MRRENLHKIRQRPESLECALIKLMCQLLSRLLAKQIRSTNISHEEKIASENQPRRVLAARIVEQFPADMLRGVPGGVDRAQTDAANAHLIAIFDGMISIFR